MSIFPLFPSRQAGIKAPLSQIAKEWLKQCALEGKVPVVEAMGVWRKNKLKECE